jgi:hypothetical protein
MERYEGLGRPDYASPAGVADWRATSSATAMRRRLVSGSLILFVEL